LIYLSGERKPAEFLMVPWYWPNGSWTALLQERELEVQLGWNDLPLGKSLFDLQEVPVTEHFAFRDAPTTALALPGMTTSAVANLEMAGILSVVQPNTSQREIALRAKVQDLKGKLILYMPSRLHTFSSQ
jgi:hypothetical protein